MIPYYPQEPLLFPHIQSYTEKKFEIFLDSDSSDFIPIDLFTPLENSEFDDDVFQYEPFCNESDDQSVTFAKE